MSYGKIKDTFWTDAKVVTWPDDAKLLALYFLSGPHRNMLGCVRVPDGYILTDFNWTKPKLDEALRCLAKTGFIVRDAVGWTMIVNQLRHDPPLNVNHGKALIRLATEIPRTSSVLHTLLPTLAAALKPIGMGIEALSKPIATPEPLPEPEPLQEPLPESVGASPSAPPAARGTRFSLETLPEEWRAFCQADRPDLDPGSTFAQFHDFWIAKPGKDGRKVDWYATWRNWVRNQKRLNGTGPPANQPETDFVKRLKAEANERRRTDS